MFNARTVNHKALLNAVLIAGSLMVPSLFDAARAQEPETVVRDRFTDEIVGTGPDLIFIPGLASSRDSWKAVADRLKDQYRVHLIQLAGFAGEPARANAQGPVLAPTAEAIDSYFTERHLTPAVVIGHSLGGTITLYIAEHHAGDLRKAMLVDTLPFYALSMAGPNATVASITPMADAIRSGRSKMSDAQRKQMLAAMAVAQADKDMIAGWSNTSDPGVVANALADDLTLDLRPGLGAITTPLTLIYPDYAPLGSPPGATDALYRGVYSPVPHMTFVRADSSLHFIMLDQPRAFGIALDRFLAD